MGNYVAEVVWSLAEGEDFKAGRYSRGHSLAFDGGLEVAGSASPLVVGNRWSVAEAVDPEEMLVASLSACHMLTFLHRARLAGFVVRRYADRAEGRMERLDGEREWVSRVVLNPRIEFEGEAPGAAALEHLHHEAHEHCFIANSVKTEVVVAG